MGRHRPEVSNETEMEMTPMIDVVFLLLIFFIVTLKFKTLEGKLEAALPKDRGTATSPAEPIEKIEIVVTVANPGILQPDPKAKKAKIYVGRVVNYTIGTFKTQAIDSLREHLEKLKRGAAELPPVSLSPRRNVINGDVIPILDVVIETGFEEIAFTGDFEDES